MECTALRKDIFKLLDEVLKTNRPLIVRHKGQKIKIKTMKSETGTERLFNKPVRKDAVKGNSDDLVNLRTPWEIFGIELKNEQE